jgi:O-acetyl-ADP-ribose deacetylase (regulator of RNase III)
MITYTSGNIVQENTEAIVNTVNCVGVMGRGIALQFKKAYPDNYKAYEAACKRSEVQPGRLFVYQNKGLINPHYIINFPTKSDWRGKSRIEYIESGLEELAKVVREKNIKSIAIPPLGCGLGGLDWTKVKSLIESTLKSLESVNIIVYEPKGSPVSEKMVHSRKQPNMTPGRAALVGLIHRYLAGLLDPYITLLEVHKLMYFMQAAGENLRLKYMKGYYGPYAHNLRHVLNTMEGYFISGCYFDGDDNPQKQLNLLPGAIKEAKCFLDNHYATRERVNHVSNLVDGFESSFGLELLSKVHWVATHEDVPSIEDIIICIDDWNNKKRHFTERQIRLAANILAQKNWIGGEDVNRN